MKAQYQNEYNDFEDCIYLADSLNGEMVLIELDGMQGWCSAHLVEIDDLQS